MLLLLSFLGFSCCCILDGFVAFCFVVDLAVVFYFVVHCCCGFVVVVVVLFLFLLFGWFRCSVGVYIVVVVVSLLSYCCCVVVITLLFYCCCVFVSLVLSLLLFRCSTLFWVRCQPRKEGSPLGASAALLVTLVYTVCT